MLNSLLKITVVSFLLAVATGQFVFAQEAKLHMLGVFDTLDKSIGKSTKIDRDELFEVLVKSFDKDGRRHRFESVTLSGVDATRKRVLDYYKNLQVRSIDTVLFYYSGHGGESTRDGHFLSLRDGRLDRTDLRLAMRKKGARQTIIVSDCCSNIVDGGRAPERQNLNWDAVSQLMFKQRGVTDITAAKKGFFSFGNSAYGGMFTRAFIKNLCETPKDLDKDDDGFVTWSEFASRVSVDANGIFRQRYNDMVKNPKIGPLLRRVGQDTMYTRRFYLNDTDLKVYYRRKLVFSNQTGAPLEIKLHYRTMSRDDSWYWYNATPGNQVYKFSNGKVNGLDDDGFLINASRVRFYASAPRHNRVWKHYNDTDLWIAPREGYLGKEMGTYTHKFSW